MSPGVAGARPLTPLPALIADIGGTNARFALVGRDGAVSAPVRVAVAGHETIEGALAEALAALPERPVSAVLALAGLVHDGRAHITNGRWVADPRSLRASFGFSDIVLLGDFEALALGVPFLGAADLLPIAAGTADPDGTSLVIGPGTGLGVAALLTIDGRFVPVRGEGGHIDLGPRTRRDLELWPHLVPAGGRVSAEMLLCGPGLLRLHRAVAASRGSPAAFAEPRDLTAAGLSGDDALATETLDLFVTYLGRFAGDLALVFLPTGGVFIGGGIAPVLAARLRSGLFLDAFADKAPHSAVMAGLASAIIVHPAPALVGLSALVVDPERFSIDLRGRRWPG